MTPIPKGLAGPPHVMARLEVHPELRRGVEDLGEEQGGLGRDGALAVDQRKQPVSSGAFDGIIARMARRQPRLTKRERKAIEVRPPGPLPEPSDRLRNLAARYGIAPENFHADGIPGMEKMSDVITEWAEPLLGPLEDAPLSSFRSALTVTMLIWNAATAHDGSAAEVAAEVLEVLGGAGGPIPPGMDALIAHLVESRRTTYGSDPRVVLRVEAEDVGEDRRLRVVSGMP